MNILYSNNNTLTLLYDKINVVARGILTLTFKHFLWHSIFCSMKSM